ncbi:MAG TPA: FHA domain-containing protein [Ktedonobacterales bacterium]
MSVRCSQGHENPDGSAFCDECGEPLAAPAPTFSAPIPAAPPVSATMTCPSCGSANPAGESFCSNCGANLNAPPAEQPVMAAAPAAPAVSFAPAPPVAVKAQVVVESDNTTFDLAGKAEALIGREDAVSNIFPDIDLTPHNGEEGGVGRRHARILYSGSQYMLEDLNSINFTFLNKQKIAPKTPTPLKDGDEIRLGRIVLRFKTL